MSLATETKLKIAKAVTYGIVILVGCVVGAVIGLLLPKC